MSPAEALEVVREAGLRGVFRISGHARTRMEERGVRYADLRFGLSNATRCVPQDRDRFRVASTDLDGDALDVVVAIEDHVVVVTLF